MICLGWQRQNYCFFRCWRGPTNCWSKPVPTLFAVYISVFGWRTHRNWWTKRCGDIDSAGFGEYGCNQLQGLWASDARRSLVCCRKCNRRTVYYRNRTIAVIVACISTANTFSFGPLAPGDMVQVLPGNIRRAVLTITVSSR